jgi:hypothetical protein
MSLAKLKAAAVLCSALLLLLGTAVGASGTARVVVNNLILSVDGGFTPRMLPAKRFAPIDFAGHFDISARSGGQPPALQQLVADFDSDGRLNASGLPTCPAEEVASASVAEARRLCAGAIVGTGTIDASIELAGGRVPATSPLTLFNGPPVEGHPTIVLHAQTTSPATQTFAIAIPITRRGGEFRYRAILDVPPILGGRGSITHVDVKIGRRFRIDGQPRSYVSARCRDHILRTHGRFTFTDGTIVEGSVEKFCRNP